MNQNKFIVTVSPVYMHLGMVIFVLHRYMQTRNRWPDTNWPDIDMQEKEK